MIKVTVICITYNHEKYIRDALESFVRQQTNFDFEVIVHDDASKDNTKAIIAEYAEKYPQIIIPIYEVKNQWSKGKDFVKEKVWPIIRGEYVIYCEGDDYWIDDNKLQKQVNFMESHPEVSLCFHPVRIMDGIKNDKIFPDEVLLKKVGELTLKSLLKTNFIQTNSALYRWRMTKENFYLMPAKILPGDWYLHLLHAEVGKIAFLPDIMSVYRRTSQGVWTGCFQDALWFCRRGRANLRFLSNVERHFNISKTYDRVFVAYSAFYAACYLNRPKIIAKFPFFTKPSHNTIVLIGEMVWYKLLSLLSIKHAKYYKARFKSLTLWLKWKRSKKANVKK